MFKDDLRVDLEHLYGDKAEAVLARLSHVAADFVRAHGDLQSAAPVIPQEPILIAYADQVRDDREPPLAVMKRWADRRLADLIGVIHLLPFFPWSSDEGFAVKDYRAVAREFGEWADVEALSERFDLMFDAVINHASSEGAWFAAFKSGMPPYDRYFRTVSDADDMSRVVRPRTTPLSHAVETADGPRKVWTTFSSDQIDLDYGNPDVLIDIVDVLLGYVGRGARLIRLDAVCYLWKESGTTCIHLDGTHRIVRIFRTVLDAVAPSVLLITETNVPHAENVSYFGGQRAEAQLVYNFALPPLLLDAVYRSDARRISAWAKNLTVPRDGCAFFNITATHDGIGLRGAQDFMTPQEISQLATATLERGGLVSNRRLADGAESPYELNITFFDALLAPGDDPDGDLAIRRYLTVQSVAMALKGVPGIYFHNLLGTPSDHAALEGKDASLTEFKRVLNRKRMREDEIEGLLGDPLSRAARVFEGYRQRLGVWRKHPAFAPTAQQRILNLDDRVLGIERGGAVLCLHNLCGDPLTISLGRDGPMRDLLSGTLVDGETVSLEPWGMAWLDVYASSDT